MVFSSSVFLFAFFPLVVVAYYVSPRKIRNVVLLVFSLFFYAWGEPVYVFLMIFSILVNWSMGLAIGKTITRKKLYLIFALVVNLGILGFFKYEGFIADNINALAGTILIQNLELPLPIGISFFTLQAVSYIVDVYRGKVTPQKKLLNLGMYIAMFPQLIAGPIVRYETIEDQVNNRKETLDGFMSGLRLFIIGLAKKVLLANTVAILADQMLASNPGDIGFIGAWGGIIAYSFQIFFDFSGYSDMAIGLGKMFGFTYLRNFNYPYISKSITEFWRRWHISLSSFFRDYIYIPLGGNRVSRGRWVFNIALVWGLTGLWHGASWNYVFWGFYYGTLLILEKMVYGKTLARLPHVVQHLYTIIIFVIGWVFFWITDPTQLVEYFASMFGANGFTGTKTFWELHVWEYLPVFAICAVASTPVIPWIRKKIEGYLQGTIVEEDAAPMKGNEHPPAVALAESARDVSSQKGLVMTISIVVDIALFALLVLSIFSVVSGSYNPFIYFQF